MLELSCSEHMWSGVGLSTWGVMLTFKLLITEHIIFWNLELGYSVPYYPLAAYLEAIHSHP